jgi:hypothetical protein
VIEESEVRVRTPRVSENPVPVENAPPSSVIAVESPIWWVFSRRGRIGVAPEVGDYASVRVVLRNRMRAWVMRLHFWGVLLVCLVPAFRVSAQNIPGAIGASGFGSNVNNLNTLGNSAQSSPLSLGATVGQRGSLAGWQSYRNYRSGSSLRSVGGGERFAHLGPVDFSFNAYTSINFDTNINSSPDDPIADMYLIAGVNLGINWIATRRNQLQLSLGMNFTQYLENTEYNDNGILLAPYTGIDYRIYFSDFVLTLYDYPSITNNGGQQSPAITNSVNFRQLGNSGGFSLLWHPNQLLFLTGFERSDVVSLSNEEFNSQNSISYSWYGTVSYDITPTTSTGIRLQASNTQYTQEILNNAFTTQSGLFFASTLTEYTSLYLEGGIQTGSFSDTGRQTDALVFQENNGANTNVEGTLGGSNYMQPYFLLGISNRLTRYLTQTIGLSRLASGSSVSDYQETNRASYQLQYRLNRFTNVGVMGNYEYGTISRTTGPVPFTNLTGRLDFTFAVRENTNVGVSWTYYQNSVPELNADYTRQLFTLSLSHQF